MIRLLSRVYRKMNKKHFFSLMTLLIVIVTVEIIATQAIPHVREVFYSALDKRDIDGFHQGLWLFVALYGTFILSQGFKLGVARRAALLVRETMSKVLLKAWVRTQEQLDNIDNPDQRIAEDVRLATDTFIKVGLEFFISAVLVLILLIQASGNPNIAVAAVLYTVGVSILAARFRRPLIAADISLQHREADYRLSLVKLSLKQGDFSAKHNLTRVVESVKRQLGLLTGFNIFSAAQNSVSVFVPWLLLAPSLFAGTLSFGEFMANTALFELIVVNSTIAITLYPEVTKTESAWIRIQTFFDTVSPK
jgi:putative ATP-binding cassette transporter